VTTTSPESGKLINIDNGGTLTDICVIDGARVYRTKTITTPHDLSQCLFEGLKKASRAVYGKEDVLALLLSTTHIRYSTTQGTNALVERKGPRLGLILGGGLQPASLQGDAHAQELFAALVGRRVRVLDASLAGEALESAAVQAVNALASDGANRVVIVFGGADRAAAEVAVKSKLLRTFPPHLLGALPILYAHELVDDADDSRRGWTALFNSFLHPAMERFLYTAEHKLRDFRTRNPLLIFRNDGHSARVAKTVAVKTYSSGPRGGMEGAKALAGHYGFKRLLSMDIGGTTTDIGLVENEVVRAKRRGTIEGVVTSLPLCDVVSAGVGGSSIIRVVDGAIRVGPESVGSAPGPACFGLGGREATMTDAFLLAGLLDPASYFGGELRIDVDRARSAVTEKVAQPLGLTLDQAVEAMERAWVGKVVDSLRHFDRDLTPQTVLAAFGGAGPFAVCRVAEVAGIERVVIPGLAAVFSAFGIGFSDIGHEFMAALTANDTDGLAACRELLLERAKRGMFAEGATLEECRIEESLNVASPAGERSIALSNGKLPAGLPADAELSLALTVVKPVAHATINGRFGQVTRPAVKQSTRNVLVGGQRRDLPLYRVEEQPVGATGTGPAVLEEAFFTCRIDVGWSFEINDAGDILLIRTPGGSR
jgi:N-methylhydantoinase A/oxoprolinase/acetone carboxylase beta subunit